MKLRLVLVCLSSLATVAAQAETANMMAKSRRWVVEGWEKQEVVRGRAGGAVSLKPARPSGLRGRTVGATVGLVGATVHTNRRSSPPKDYILKLADGPPVRAEIGQTVRIGKRRMKVLGERDGALLLQDKKTKRVLRFRPEGP